MPLTQDERQRLNQYIYKLTPGCSLRVLDSGERDDLLSMLDKVIHEWDEQALWLRRN